MGIERREHPRFKVMAQVKVEMDDTVLIMEVDNLSESGVYVMTERPEEFFWIRMGEPLDVDVFPTKNPENIHLTGLIARINESAPPHKRGFAIMFTDITADNQAKLRRLIEEHKVLPSADPSSTPQPAEDPRHA